MLKDEIIIDVVDNLGTEDKISMLCFICYFRINKYRNREKETLTKEEFKEILILISIIEKNNEDIQDKKLFKIFKERMKETNFETFKKEYKNKIKLEKEEILTYIKNIYETIELIKKEKELKKQEEKQKQEKEIELKKDKLNNQKKLNEILVDNISL